MNIACLWLVAPNFVDDVFLLLLMIRKTPTYSYLVI